MTDGNRRYGHGVTCVCGSGEPGDGEHWGESTVLFSHPTTSTSTTSTKTSSLLLRRSLVDRCRSWMCSWRRRWYCHHVGIQEAHPHRSIPSLRVPSPNGVQEGSGKNTHAPGWGAMLFRCKSSPGREAVARSTGEEWLPVCFCAEAQTPPDRPGWETDNMNVRNHPIHPRVVPVHLQSAKLPGHQGHFPSFSDTRAGAGPP